MFFLAGAVLHLYSENIIVSRKILAFFIAITFWSVTCRSNLYFLILPFSLSYIVISIAIYLPFSKTDRYGDFSYGVYMYAFSIQQSLSFFEFNKYGFTIYVILSIFITSFLSILSWFLIEKPSLALKKFSLPDAISSKNS